MRAPVFSVIVPFHNGAEFLGEAIASLQGQSLGDWEALLIDDASTDGAVALARAACRADPRLRLLHEPGRTRPRGAGATRNLGLAVARGRHVAFLDADDRWLPAKLARQKVVFDAGADIVFGAYRRIDAHGRALGEVGARPELRWRDALDGNPIGCLTGAYRRARFPQARMPRRAVHEDYAFWLALLRQGVEARGLPEVLAEYRVRPGSRSSCKWRGARAVWQILGEEEIGLPRQLLCFARYAGGALARRMPPALGCGFSAARAADAGSAGGPVRRVPSPTEAAGCDRPSAARLLDTD